MQNWALARPGVGSFTNMPARVSNPPGPKTKELHTRSGQGEKGEKLEIF
ncbi:MAG: hypothetical protein Q8886_02690 [Candidatus Phytoplasma australasiaticum]|nr:hypothetical protein [Candidatus Phytoplasma australasiaticum]